MIFCPRLDLQSSILQISFWKEPSESGGFVMARFERWNVANNDDDDDNTVEDVCFYYKTISSFM